MNENAKTEERQTLPDVSTLSVECVDVKPVDYDWTDIPMDVGGDGYACSGELPWRVIAPVVCSECEGVPDPRAEFANGESRHGDGDPCQDQTCEGTYEDWIARGDGPVMSCYYPLPSNERWAACHTDEGGDLLVLAAARKLDGLPLCLVEFDDGSYGLALTGGGMDLSWEICEAFMRLGFLPPFHFADLPAMCGRGTISNGGERGVTPSELDVWIVEGCRRTHEWMIMYCQRGLKNLRDFAPVTPRGV